MAELLAVEGLRAGYGSTVALDGINLVLRQGECLALIGRNGVGKTTLLTSLLGHTTRHGGSIRFMGQTIETLPIHARARLGLGLVPQEREVFPSLTVEENLTVARLGGDWTTERVFDLFPSLARRRRNRGNQLSGGEQQMLAIGRALMGGPRLLLLDEPLEGLAPVVAEAVLAALEKLRDGTGLSMILVEQHARIALGFAPRAMALDRGRIVFDGPSQTLLADEAKLSAIISVAASTEAELPRSTTQQGRKS